MTGKPAKVSRSRVLVRISRPPLFTELPRRVGFSEIRIAPVLMPQDLRVAPFRYLPIIPCGRPSLLPFLMAVDRG